MTSVCLQIIVLLLPEQGETMQCAVWKDEHEQTETETAISVFGMMVIPNSSSVSVFNFKKTNNFISSLKTENRNHGFGMNKTENRTDFQICKLLHH